MGKYDLEDRTLIFSKRIVLFAKNIPFSIVNRRLVDQLVRSATSIGANYREANETKTKNDFIYRMRISRKEAKETLYWLKLIKEANDDLDNVDDLIGETNELIKITATIIKNSSAT